MGILGRNLRIVFILKIRYNFLTIIQIKEAAMGTLVIRIPEDINEEYEVANSKIVKKLISFLKLKAVKPKTVQKDKLAGLFENDAELMDQVVEWAMQTRERDPLRYYE